MRNLKPLQEPPFFTGAAIEEESLEAHMGVSTDAGYESGEPSHADPPPYSKEDSQYELKGASSSTVQTTKGMQAPASLDLLGLMAIEGSVKAMGALNFLGDFSVVGFVESLGPITVNGSLESKDRVKSFTSISVVGKLSCRGRLEAATGLLILGNCECDGDVKVAGKLVIKGSLKCTSLTVHGSLTVLGDHSAYEVENNLTIHGALVRTKDAFEGQNVQFQ